MRKKAGGRTSESCVSRCGVLLGRWDRRWLEISPVLLTYRRCHHPDDVIREKIFIDRSFSYEYGKAATGAEFGITLINSTRRLSVEAENIFEFFRFLKALRNAKLSSDYAKDNPYNSFAPLREMVECKWFVDGNDYFE
jgi:phospholipase D1/2